MANDADNTRILPVCDAKIYDAVAAFNVTIDASTDVILELKLLLVAFIAPLISVAIWTELLISVGLLLTFEYKI